MKRNIEKKIISRLVANCFEGYDIWNLNLTLDGTDEIIDDIEIDREENAELVLLYHGDEGSVGSFDMLPKTQQKKICDYIERKMKH